MLGLSSVLLLGLVFRLSIRNMFKVTFSAMVRVSVTVNVSLGLGLVLQL